MYVATILAGHLSHEDVSERRHPGNHWLQVGYLFFLNNLYQTMEASVGFPIEDDARNYLNEHKLLELLNNLMAQTVFNRPSRNFY